MRFSVLIRVLLLVIMVIGLSFTAPARPAYASALVVNTLTDENDHSCVDGDCSLRDAIEVAASGDTITFSVTGTITLGGTDLLINQNLTITGPGSALLTIDGNNQSRIFALGSGKTVTISGMTMTNGKADPNFTCGGGAISNDADLSMNDVVITKNSAPAGNPITCAYPRGGAITVFNSTGSLTITNSTISDNSTFWDGGGIYFQSTAGTLNLTNVIISGNHSTNSNAGGIHIENANAPVVFDQVTIFNNFTDLTSGTYGGGLYTKRDTTITNSIIDSNSTGNGGGIYSSHNLLTISNSTISGNSAADDGGGIYLFNATTHISSSTFNGNITTGLSNSDGGAIMNLGNAGTSALTVVNSTFSGNGAPNGVGGAIKNNASGNTATDIATASFINSTIVGNNAKQDFFGGGVFATTAGAPEISTITLSNSIVYGNTIASGTNGENCARQNSATIITNNHNLFQNLANDCTAGATDITSSGAVSTIVNTLGNNGGSTKTRSLPTGSPAIDAGDVAICTAAPVGNASQNGFTRSQGALCDIGAYELDNIPPLVQSIVRANPDPTSAASVDFTVTFSEIVTGVDKTDFSLTAPGVSSAAVSGVSGSGSIYTVTVGTGVGNGTIRLDLTDDDSIKDTALNLLGGTGTGNGDFNGGQFYTINKSPIFVDVPYVYWANSYIERLYKAGVTGGCVLNPLQYCPDNTVTRAQMAIFLLKGMHTSGFTPPSVGAGTGFNDVPVGAFADAWIKQLALEQITSGCGNGNYCPDSSVTRAQMAVFLLKAKHGASYVPPIAKGVFTDVPVGYWADDWIEQLAFESITGGCGNGNYCPDAPVTRAQMAVFLVKTFGLP